MTALVQVVPSLPLPEEGVGSYALGLARALAERHGIESRFVVGDPAWRGPAPDGLEAAPVRERSAAALAEALGAGPVLLHYANYGYQRRGCPRWLVEGLSRDAGRRRLVAVFHEVYASGPPWTSSFWLSPVQRRLAAAVARRAAALVTSLDLYAAALGRWVPRERIALLPVFSTVGEPAAPPPLATRVPRLVVFGGPGVRARAWRRPEALAAACRALEVEEVADVGPGAGAPAAIAGRPVTRLGSLPAAEVSRLLAASLAGFMVYPPDFLPKSTIFAAYCAHGLLPVCSWARPARRGLPRRGRAELPSARRPESPESDFEVPGAGAHDGLWWSPDGPAPAPAEAQELAAAARAWYLSHALPLQAERYRALLDGAGC